MELKRYWEIIYRKRWIFLQVVAVIVGIALVCSFLVTPIYSISAKTWLRLENFQPYLISDPHVSLASPRLIFAEDRNIVDTLTALIDINPITSKVIRDLDLKDATGKLIESKDFVITFTRMPKLLFFQKKGVRIKRVKAAEVLEIMGYSTSREEAAKIANAVATSFLAFLSEIYREKVNVARLAVEKQIGEIGKKLTEAEEVEAAFRIKEKLSDPRLQISTLIAERSALETRIKDAERALAEMRSSLAAIQNVLQKQPGFYKRRITLERNPNITNYKDQLLDLEVELAGSLSELTIDHPKAKNLKNKVHQVKQALRREIAKTLASETTERNPYLDSLMERQGNAEINIIAQKAIIQAVSKQVADKNREISVITDKQKKLNILVANTSVYNNQYRVLKNKLENIKILETMDIADAVVVQPGVISKYYKKDIFFPRKKLILVMSLLLAIPFGLFLIFFLDYLDDTIKNPSDVTEKLKKTVLGIIPKVKNGLFKNDMTKRAKRDLQFLHRIWDLRANIKLATAGKGLKILAITSTARGEGKSTISHHLATTFAEAGQKVLLVDFNLRRPNLHMLFHLPDVTPGITNFLLGEIGIDEIVHPTPTGGLYLIPGGSILPNPVKIMDTLAMPKLVESVKDDYDLIILDTSAVEDGSDLGLIAPHANCILLVVASGYAPENNVRKALEILETSKIEVLGVVFNKSEYV